MSRTIICRNEDGIEGVFGYDFEPFFIENLQGITGIYNNVAASENTMIDGATYQGSVVKQRYITMEIKYKVGNRKEAREQRNFLYRLFKSKSAGVFTHSEDGEIRSIEYHVVSIDIPENKGILKTAAVELSCPDPFFRAMDDVVVHMAWWESLFEFPHEFSALGEELGTRHGEVIKAVENDTSAALIGLTMRFEAMGHVQNPAMYHVETGEYIKVGTPENPLDLDVGDVVTITTGRNNKNVLLTRNGITSIINQYLDEDSEFIQLRYGSNTLKYDSSSGIEYLNVKVTYRQLYSGV